MNKTFNKNSHYKWLYVLHVIGFVFVCVYCAFAHVLAKISPNFLTYLIFPANLSLWEQGKLLLVGMSIWFIIEYFIIGRKLKGFLFVSSVVTVALPILMIIIYTSHSQLFGDFSTEMAHIILTVALVLAGFLSSAFMLTSEKDYSLFTPYGIALYAVVVLIYGVLTFIQPESGVFYDAINSSYGPVWPKK